MLKHIVCFISLCAGLSLLACTDKSTPEVYKGNTALKVMPSFSPEHAPRLKKGPGDMPDLKPMWQPLNAVESSGAVRRRGGETLDALTLPNDLRLWLPTGEQTILYGYLYRLNGQQRYVCARAAERAKLHLPVVKEALMAYGLPVELTALPLLLSSYEAEGVSSRNAAGLWQLTPDTARGYGLTVNHEVDERLDPVKSSGAAARYLKHLYERFASWQIVILAYREGEGAVRNAIDTAGSNNFEDLAESSRSNMTHKYVLPEQALQNVPKFVVALFVMTNSKKLGFTEDDILEVSKPTAIEAPKEHDAAVARHKALPGAVLIELPIR